MERRNKEVNSNNIHLMSSTRILIPPEDLNECNSQQGALPWDRRKCTDHSGGMTNCGPENLN